ncbi:hypothetical protein R1flu_026023 [Riccia fluitans]|uniref:Uncharacterized protein n=1 Tax=Riccia fluitans TaxID=41844 RepID=A0ABD1XF86_9MARC
MRNEASRKHIGWNVDASQNSLGGRGGNDGRRKVERWTDEAANGQMFMRQKRTSGNVTSIPWFRRIDLVYHHAFNRKVPGSACMPFITVVLQCTDYLRGDVVESNVDTNGAA